MDYREALAKVTHQQSEEGYLQLSLDFSARHLVLPYAEGLAVLKALAKAERINEAYQKPAIEPLHTDSLTVHLMSAVEHRRYQIAQLLGVELAEVQAMEQAASHPKEQEPPF